MATYTTLTGDTVGTLLVIISHLAYGIIFHCTSETLAVLL